MKRGGGGKRRDATEAEIVDGLRKAGAFVVRCHGDGAPDLICYWKHQWLPLEIKTGNAKPRSNQQMFPVARSLAEAFAHFR